MTLTFFKFAYPQICYNLGVTLNILFCDLLFSFKIPYEHLTTLL